MVITVEERRNTLKLFNVSEAARKLGIPVQEMHRRVKAGELPMPEVRLGRRRYYHASDLTKIAERCGAKQNHP
jgi:predicted site-specific integrase-resolvase